MGGRGFREGGASVGTPAWGASHQGDRHGSMDETALE